MDSLIFAATALCAAAVLVGCTHLLKKLKISTALSTKILAVILFVVSFLRYFHRIPAVYFLRGLTDPSSPFSADGVNAPLTALGIILLWFSYAAILSTVLSAFFNYKTLHRIVNLFSLPVFIAIIALFETYAIATLGNGVYSLSTKKLWIMAIEIGMGLAIIALNIMESKRFEIPKTLKDIANYLYGLVFAIFAIMPCYVPQAFFNGIDPTLKIYDITPEHRVVLYFAVILPFVAYLLLKNKPVDVNRMILIYATLAFFWIYIGRWELRDFKELANWPLHLCNTAMIFIPLCLIFKMKRMYNFSLFVGSLGAVFAMLMPNTFAGLNVIETESISYWLNHYVAFGMPLLIISLKIFKRPKFRQWIYAMITLFVYFCSMLFINAYLTAKNGRECDFFFINSDFIVSKLGLWAERIRDITVNVTVNGYELTFYPLYQTIFILSYVAMSVGVWFLLGMMFGALDADEDRTKREKDYKRMKKDLKKYLGSKPDAAVIKGNEEPSLVLRNFSKRYGRNKHYSVNNVSFEVKGGEIFGFLGPNGAGKSTIIKSIVGIQTITSGNIEICGYDVEKQPVEAKMNTAFVPDHYALYENLTGREYINYIADLFEVTKEDRDAFINKYVEVFQLTGAFDNQMKTYSHGMKQKITIMSALVHNPKVWILDEPLTGLDPTSIHEVKECMKEHAAKGNIVFFSSHIIDVVEKLCDKIAIIKKGQLRAYKSMQELNEQGIELEKYYLDIIYDGNDEHVPYTEPEAGTEEANS